MNGFHEAKERVEFRLTYARTEPREFAQEILFGPRIPDAHGNGTSSGDWCSGDWPDDDAGAEEWLAHFMQMAVNESIHEALEHLHVDGRSYLDPHGEMEAAIYRATETLCRTLTALRARSLSTSHNSDIEDSGDIEKGVTTWGGPAPLTFSVIRSGTV